VLDAALDTAKPLVLDADGLNLLAARSQGWEARKQAGNWILTPHPGEAARLLECDTREIQFDRFAAAGAIAQRFGAVAVLKGSGTVVQGSEGVASVACEGNPGMASGGMGDVLTGIIAAGVAQGASLEQAARFGVCLHGRAADEAALNGERGLLAGDLIERLRPLVNAVAG
jgi:ADP-dependent NAD(P)H-hydrate dehydratase / NAD(P)H-hydrate epimerase